jgi:hypothetical protein
MAASSQSGDVQAVVLSFFENSRFPRMCYCSPRQNTGVEQFILRRVGVQSAIQAFRTVCSGSLTEW